MTETQKKSYSDTVHLPKTNFPMKGELPKREPERLRFWEETRVHERMAERAAGRKPFVLHDGPPYANGHIHIGHALNKILKDMVVKSQSMMGRRTPYRPGWDCHGLPIEHALLKEMKMSKRGVKDINAFRAQAREFASRFIDIQRAEFRRLGVLGDWDKPYTTMSNEYEAAILNAFRRLYAQGYIYRGLKAVTWCVTCETALAEAEVEYKEKASPSVYVALPIQYPKQGFPFLGNKANVLVWTTTPWTLPANMAVAFHSSLKYVLVRMKGAAQDKTIALLIAEARLTEVLKALGASEHEVMGSWTGKQLVEANLVCETPFAYLEGFKYKESKAVLADYVTAEDGTGIVHTAPGHGVDDFNTGKKYGLEILCPVDGSGHFTPEAGPFVGKRLFDEANEAVIEELEKSGRLLARQNLQHSYPHCWRCKNPIAFRATEQWFLNVTHEDLRAKLLKAVSGARWFPEAGQARISAMVSSRPDWCISRQRLWGTPIPMLRCAQCREFLGNDAALAAVEDKVRREGSDFWFADWGKKIALGGNAADALAWDFMPAGAPCAKCAGRVFERETDILDVWVDSGASWLAVLEPEGNYPCELYLEGSDQHRGWFQSSLVLSTALEGRAPYRSVLTHGFVLDDKGRAMHKSLGNVVSPQQVIDRLGADVLRLWVALADYSDDVRISDKLLEGPTETYRKLRNTFKYLLGNICDFDPALHAVPYERMPELERYMLGRLRETDASARQAYEAFAFRKAATALVDFCNLDLSSFYLDVRKDALYTLKQDHATRRSAQTVMWESLLRLLCLAAPILSFTCEEAWSELRSSLKERGSRVALEESVFLHDLPAASEAWGKEIDDRRWAEVLRVRGLVLAALEEKRALKVIGASLQAKVVLTIPSSSAELLKGLGAEAWAEFCIVSALELKVASDAQEARAAVEKAPGAKCPRCWRYREDLGASPKDPELCSRCVSQLA